MLRPVFAWVLLLLTVLSFGLVHTADATVVTASHTRLPTTTGWFNTGAGMAFDAPTIFDNRKAQTFIATETGIIDEVAFVAYQSAGTTAPLRVDITSVVGDLPGESLAAAIVPITAFPETVTVPELNVSADFSLTGLLLQAGTSYGIVFSSETPNANYRMHGVRSSNVPTSDPYLGGSQFSSQNGSPFESSILNSDLYFQVTVFPIPEPASVWLAIGGSALAFLIFSRQHSQPKPSF